MRYPWPSAEDGGACADAPLVESAARAWVLEQQLASADELPKCFDPVGVGVLTSLCYPKSSLEKRVLFAQLLGWIFVQDDEVDDAAVAHDPARLALRYRRFVDVMTGALDDQASSDPFERALGTLCDRIRDDADPAWYRAFTASMRGFWVDGVVAEARARADGVTLAPTEYLHIREHSIGLLPFLDFVELAHGFTLPRATVALPLVQSVRRRTARLVTYANDVFSFEKERRAGDGTNLVHILMHSRSLSLNDAVDAVIGEHDRELALLIEELATAERGASRELRRYLDGHRHWLRGALDWQRRSLRYAKGRALLEQQTVH